MNVTIARERPDTIDAVSLIEELESQLAPFYPSTSRHGYSVDQLIRNKVAFFVTRNGNVPLGCGGVQIFEPEYGELKRMFVRPQFRGQGLAKFMLEHLERFTLGQNISLMRLETGLHQKDAIALYEHLGYIRRGPFGDYRADPLSLFFEKRIGDT